MAEDADFERMTPIEARDIMRVINEADSRTTWTTTTWAARCRLMTVAIHTVDEDLENAHIDGLES